MKIANLHDRHLPELARHIRNKHYEPNEAGIHVQRMGLFIGGSFRSRLNDGPASIGHNKFTTQGLNYILDVALSGGSAITAWYLAPFSGNVTVESTWTGANFTANATEFTNYTQATRVAWQEGGPTSAEIDNGSNLALFTLGVAGGSIRGYGVLQASAKSATTGVLLAAGRDDRLGLVEGDGISVEYGVVAQDAA